MLSDNEDKRKGIFLILVYSICFLLLGSSIYSLFVQEDIEIIDENSGEIAFSDILDVKMEHYISGLVGGNEAEEIVLGQIDNQTNLLTNNYDGYSLNIPSEWSLDDKDHQYIIHLRSEMHKLSIFKHEVNLSFEEVMNYLLYSNYYVRKDYGPITMLSEETRFIGDKPFIIYTYDREPIRGIKKDLCRYRQYHLVHENDTIYSFQLKTTQESWDQTIAMVESSLETFGYWNVSKVQVERDIPEREVHGVELTGDRINLTIPDEKNVFGLWHAVHNDYWTEVKDLEENLDFEFEFFMEYFNFNDVFSKSEPYISDHYDQGHVLLISLQPFTSSHGRDYDGSVVLCDMLNGDYDRYLFDWARGLRDLNEPVLLRFGNEMNGDWAQWCSWFYGLDPDLFIMAWARIHTIFDYVGADNVLFVWNPHDRTYPDYDWQAQYLYYPGDDMVDWIGLTAYNNGVTRPTEFWRDFEECYSSLYDEYMIRYSDKPFMITEFACNEIGGDKSEWINVGLNSLFEDYPNIWISVWWNGVDDTWIYDLDSTRESQNAAKNVLRHPNVMRDAVQIKS